MITDRELDARLAAAAGLSDADLPPLPLDLVTLIGQPAGTEGPASLVAARQLVDDAYAARTSPRSPRRRRRRVLLRAGAAALAVAAAWATVVLPADPAVPPDSGTAAPVTPTPAPPTIALPTEGISLVAAETITFPLSLDPVPAGLTPLLSRSGGVEEQGFGPLTYSADYSPADRQSRDRVVIRIVPLDPRASDSSWPREEPDEPGATDWYDVNETGSVVIDGHEAACAQATEATGYDVAHVTWQRPDGQWLHVMGEGAYSETATLVEVAGSIVDRPQPVDLQFGLAPAGWSVTGYESGDPAAGGYLDLTNDRDPQQLLRLSLIGRQGGATIDNVVEDMPVVAPVEPVTVHGLDARLAQVSGGEERPDNWFLVGQFVDGPLLVLLAPAELTQEQVLEIADQTSYTP